MRNRGAMVLLGALLALVACGEGTATAPLRSLKGPASRLNADGSPGTTTVSVTTAPTSGSSCDPVAGEIGLDVDFINGSGTSVWSAHFTEPGYDAVLTTSGFTTPLVVRDSTHEHYHFHAFHWEPGGLPFALMWKSSDVYKDFYYSDDNAYLDVSMNGNGTCRLTVSWAHALAPAVAMYFTTPRYDTLAVGFNRVLFGHGYASDGFTEVFSTGLPTWYSTNPSVANVTSSSRGSGPFAVPTVTVMPYSSGTAIIIGSVPGVSGSGAQVTVSGGGGGGCPPHGC